MLSAVPSHLKKYLPLAMLTIVLASIFSVGYHHLDEHFQILEFAASKLGITNPNDLPWEYEAQMRPALQPLLVVVLYEALDLINTSNPFFVAFVLRLISGLLYFFCTYKLYKHFSKEITSEKLKNWLFFLSFFLWFGLYNGVRFASENWSGLFFLLAFVNELSKPNKTFKNSFITGLLLGISFLFRYQSGFLIAGFLGWVLVYGEKKWLTISAASSSVLLLVLIGILIDRWFYGEWTLSTWNYFEQNILLDKAASFGTDPWYSYFTFFLNKAIPPFSLLFIVGFITFLTLGRKHPVIWSTTLFIAIHSYIGHKELRFLFPIIYFLPFLGIKALELLQEKFSKNIIDHKVTNIFMKLFFIVNGVILIFICFKPADAEIALKHEVYNSQQENTNLYCYKNNPYGGVLDIRFYKRKNLDVIRIYDFNEVEIMPSKANLIVINKRDTKESDIPFKIKKIVYTTFPEWYEYINFNNWQSRANNFVVYEIGN